MNNIISFIDRIRYNGRIKVFLFYLFRIFKVKKNKIFLVNFEGMGFADNPKYIALELHKSDPNLEFIWYADPKTSSLPSWIRQVGKVYTFQPTTWRTIYDFVTSRIIISNTRLYSYQKVRKDQFYLMTWHGTIGLKKAENDIANNKERLSLLKKCIDDSKKCSLMISNSDFFTKFIRRGFLYNGEILENCGSPRLDSFIKYDGQDHPVHSYFGDVLDVHYLVYAPTFRNSLENVYDLDLEMVIRKLFEKYGVKYKIILRFHPALKNKCMEINYSENILNGSVYPDLYELLSESDILISDYSSCTFDMSFARKIVWLYANDIKNYDIERGFNYSFDEIPFPLAQNNKEMEMLIEQFDYDDYIRTLNSFLAKENVVEDGFASKRVAERLLNEINN